MDQTLPLSSDPLTTRPGTTILQDSETIKFCCLSNRAMTDGKLTQPVTLSQCSHLQNAGKNGYSSNRNTVQFVKLVRVIPRTEVHVNIK